MSGRWTGPTPALRADPPRKGEGKVALASSAGAKYSILGNLDQQGICQAPIPSPLRGGSAHRAGVGS